MKQECRFKKVGECDWSGGNWVQRCCCRTERLRFSNSKESSRSLESRSRLSRGSATPIPGTSYYRENPLGKGRCWFLRRAGLAHGVVVSLQSSNEKFAGSMWKLHDCQTHIRLQISMCCTAFWVAHKNQWGFCADYGTFIYLKWEENQKFKVFLNAVGFWRLEFKFGT